MIVTKKQAIRNELYKRVQEADPDRKVQLVSSGRRLKDSTTVFVLADRSLHRIPDDWPDILIYDEAHEAGSSNVGIELDRFLGVRTYGFSATPTGRSDGTDKQTRALLGPISMKIPYQAAEKSGAVIPIDVDMFPINLPDKGITNKNIKTSICIIRNTKRTRIIAETARRVIPADAQVLFMVNTVEHAMRLRKFLPDVHLIYQKITGDRFQWLSDRQLLWPSDRQAVDVEGLKEDFREGRLKRAISTFVWRDGVDFPDLGYLVRCDGLATSIGAIQMGGRLSRVGKYSRGRLISFIDYHDKLQFRGFKQIQEYRKRGWNIRRKGELPCSSFLW